MRRILSIVLLVVFVLQATGSASATPPGAQNRPSVGFDLLAAIVSTRAFLGSTMLGALATGQMPLYEAMHDTPPDFSLLTRNRQVDLAPLRVTTLTVPQLAVGQRVDLPNGMAQMRPPTPSAILGAQQSSSAALRVFRTTGSSVRAQGLRTMNVDTSVPSTTGINGFWEYEEGGIPGAGTYMVNVANGNVVVEGDDVDIPERGIDLTFRRIYNSNSGHDWHAADGSTVGNYGGGWTNTFDSHLGYDAARNVISWYDIDGARYDYQCSGTVCTPPAGQYATLTYDQGCGYWLTKKSGTAYHFYAPALNATIAPQCSLGPSYDGYLGRVVTIWARNRQNSLQFTYSWDGGDASSASHLAQIAVAHSDGQALTLTFGDVNAQRVLLSILRPDGKVVRYGYDSAIELSDVCTPGNGNSDTSPNAATICGDTTHTHHRYGYSGGPNVHQLAWADSPNWTMSWGSSPANGFDNFAYDSSSRLLTVDAMGIFNYAPNDGTGWVLQPGAIGTQLLSETHYAYSAGVTQVTDTDGHAIKYTLDALGRVTLRQAWQGIEYLTSTSAWDTQNNLIATTDPRGYETDYAYDANGNTIAVALPSVTTSVGTFRPTSLYSYDLHNNVVSSCDPVSDNPTRDWVTRPAPSDTLCPTTLGGGSTVYVYNTSDFNEPFGMLTDAYTPLGYHTQIGYATGGLTGDAGLPTSVSSTGFTQNDGNAVTPAQGFQYDAYGDVLAYTKLSTVPSSGNDSVLTYDALNRMTTVTDPDGHTSYTYYADDGAVIKTETPFQHANAMGSTVQYDADGNAIKTLAYVGGAYVAGNNPTLSSTASETDKYYDGDDRLVEVVAPQDPSDVYDKAWITRYDYDLSADGTKMVLSFDGYNQTITAHGNLFKTQELLPSTTLGTVALSMSSTGTFTKLHPTQFTDLKGGSFDVLDRSTVGLTKVNQGNNGEVTEQSTTTYDDPSAIGMPYKSCNAARQCSTPTYDQAGRTTVVSFSDTLSPQRSMVYDPDGRIASIISTVYGAQTYSYDADGRLTQSVEPSGGGVTSPATLTYHYYANGWKSALDVSSSALSQAGLFKYSYRSDGLLESQQINDAGNTLVGTTTLAFTHSQAGRLQGRTETGTGANLNPIVNTFDSYGRTVGIQYPGGTYSGAEYDATGHELGVADGIGNMTTLASYTTRGEMRTFGPVPALPNSPNTTTSFANGVGVAMPQSGWTGGQTWDPAMGVQIGNSTTNQPGTVVGSSSAFTFDAAGRNTNVVQTSVTIGQDGNEIDSGDAFARTYDDENHVVQVAATPISGPSPQLSGYNWGPNGHPIQIGSTLAGQVGTTSNMAYDTLHWDGDQLLFTTNALGQLDDIKIGAIGDITPLDPSYKGLTFYDRDLSGAIGFCHNATGAQGPGYNDPTLVANTKFGQIPRSPCGLGNRTMTAPNSIAWWSDQTGFRAQVGNGSILGMPRTDGITDGVSTIQGVRSYDPVLGGWTTPDAYSGDVRDPGSQKSYMWNGNNAVAFADPSGYAASVLFDPSEGDGAGDVRFDAGAQEAPPEEGDSEGGAPEPEPDPDKATPEQAGAEMQQYADTFNNGTDLFGQSVLMSPSEGKFFRDQSESAGNAASECAGDTLKAAINEANGEPTVVTRADGSKWEPDHVTKVANAVKGMYRRAESLLAAASRSSMNPITATLYRNRAFAIINAANYAARVLENAGVAAKIFSL